MLYLPSSGPPTASQADSDPAAGCSEECEHSGQTDTNTGLIFMHCRKRHNISTVARGHAKVCSEQTAMLSILGSQEMLWM